MTRDAVIPANAGIPVAFVLNTLAPGLTRLQRLKGNPLGWG